MAVTDYLVNSRTGSLHYAFDQDATEAMSIATAYPKDSAPAAITGLITGQADSAKTIDIVIGDGGTVTSAGWITPQ